MPTSIAEFINCNYKAIESNLFSSICFGQNLPEYMEQIFFHWGEGGTGRKPTQRCQSTEKTQSTKSNQWPDLNLSLSTTTPDGRHTAPFMPAF